MHRKRPIVLSIAGFDPSGGAGVLADIKTMEQHHVQGMAILTAHTLQTADAVLDLQWIDEQTVTKGIVELMSKYRISTIKIGIVPHAQFLKSIITEIRTCQPEAFILWDPVMKSSSGIHFFDIETLQELKPVMNDIQLITPNFLEYELLENQGILNQDSIGDCALLLKGGHRRELKGYDVLITEHDKTIFPPNTDNISEKHGSGCVLSAAIVSNIALGYDIVDSCRRAKIYTEQFLTSNSSLLGYHRQYAK